MSDDLTALANDIGKAADRIDIIAAAVVTASAHRVRDGARSRAPRKRLPHLAQAITAEVRPGMLGTIRAEVGTEKGGQGSLGHLFEYGSANTAPKPFLSPALDAEEPAFVAALLKAVNPL